MALRMKEGSRKSYVIKISYQFIYLWFFKDAGNCSDNLASSSSVISYFEGIWKEANVASFEALTQHLHEGSKENHETLSH
jgi:hypothetical protein